VDSDNPFTRGAAVFLTFVCVVIALVFFRADNVPTAINLLAGMAGFHGVAVHTNLLQLPGVAQVTEILGISVSTAPYFTLRRVFPIVVCLVIVWTLPNTQQWLGRYRTALGYKATRGWLERLVPASAWRPTAAFGMAVGLFGVFALIRALSSAPTEFLYFQF
jgi:hypothetical protein